MTNLITLEEYKTLAGRTSSSDDAALSKIIKSVSGLVKAYCNNTFVDYIDEAKVQVFNISSNSTKQLFFKETPLLSIEKVESRDFFTLGYVELDPSEYYYDEDMECLLCYSGGIETSWPKGPGSVIVRYKAGYLELPEDLRLAVAAMVTYYHKEQYKDSTQNIGSTSITNTVSNKTSMPGHIKRVLSLYRSIL